MTFVEHNIQAIDFLDSEIDSDLKELFSEQEYQKQELEYHREELNWWLECLRKDQQEVVKSLEKVKYHLSQIV